MCVQCHVYVACSIWSVPRAFSISTDLASAILRMTLMIGPFPQASNQVERFHDLKSQHLALTIENEFSSVAFSSFLPLPRDESLLRQQHASRVLSFDAQAAILSCSDSRTLSPTSDTQPVTQLQGPVCENDRRYWLRSGTSPPLLQPDILDVLFKSSTPWET